MEAADSTRYIRCATCGRYVRAAGDVVHGFCSAACAVRYRRCPTCGSYVSADELHIDRFCSEACAASYTFEEKRRSTLVQELA
jgi:endogenous inhibitor of DNA gyrase (YacG/DUF329 family)